MQLWWLQTGKISQTPMVYKGSQITKLASRMEVSATNTGWRFSVETRKEQEINHILKVHFFLMWRMFLSHPTFNAWHLLIYESLQQGFSSSCLLNTSEEPVAARIGPTGMKKNNFPFCKPFYYRRVSFEIPHEILCLLDWSLMALKKVLFVWNKLNFYLQSPCLFLNMVRKYFVMGQSQEILFYSILFYS